MKILVTYEVEILDADPVSETAEIATTTSLAMNFLRGTGESMPADVWVDIVWTPKACRARRMRADG